MQEAKNRLLIIPAAGRGSRLSSSGPKLLVPVNGKAMIDHLLELYGHIVDSIVLVLHPAAERAVRNHCARQPYVIDYERQLSPTGMLDAILIPRERVRRHPATAIWVTWCDQVAIHPETVRRLVAVSYADPDAALVLPTVWRSNPYIHFARNPDGQVTRVLHRREGDEMPSVGETDMGLFCFSRRAYLELLPQFARAVGVGVQTGERNFLPFIPWVSMCARVRTFPGSEEIEALGVNTLEDLRQVEAHLARRGGPTGRAGAPRSGIHP